MKDCVFDECLLKAYLVKAPENQTINYFLFHDLFEPIFINLALIQIINFLRKIMKLCKTENINLIHPSQAPRSLLLKFRFVPYQFHLLKIL